MVSQTIRPLAYDDTTEDWLWEDLDVMHDELTDGFTATITVDRTNGWQVAFTAAASLPASVSGAWGTLGWNDIFNSTTYVQCYLREDNLSGKVPPRVGKAKAEIASIAVTTNGAGILFADYNALSNGYTTVWATRTSAYAAWSNQYGVVGGVDDGDDNAQLSNLYEYGISGDPTNPSHQGHLSNYGNEGGSFDYIHAIRSDPYSGLDYPGYCTKGIEKRRKTLKNRGSIAFQ